MNLISGLALGFVSTVVPAICIAITIFVSYYLAGMYGIALGALGMLSTMCVCLTIDGYGPISDNAGGLSTLAGFQEEEDKEKKAEEKKTEVLPEEQLSVEAQREKNEKDRKERERITRETNVRKRTDMLDAAGNTTAAIGKGFAVGSAALVSLALFGAFVTRSKVGFEFY